MKLLRNKIIYRAVFISLVFAIGAILGSYLNSPASASKEVADHSANPAYPKNSNGQSYGSALNAVAPDDEPDLIEAYGIDGTFGYVYKKDLDGPMPKTPKEALEMQQNKPAEGRSIPLYNAEGNTIIGTFIVSHPEVHSSP